MDLSGKRAVIIGGGAGIGLAIVQALAKRGVRVFVGDVNAETAVAAAASIGSHSAGSQHCDLAEDESVNDFAEAARSALGGIDLVFNHAGVSAGGALEQITSEDWNWLLNINVIGIGRSINAFLPIVERGGWIINTSSGLGLFHDMPIAAPYIASKAAIIAYSRALATYVTNRGVGVSVFCPDITATGFLAAIRLKGIAPELLAGGMPMDQMQTPDAAAAVLSKGLEAEQFLISAVPDTAARLQAMAIAELNPGGEDYASRAPITQIGSLRLPATDRIELIAACEAFASVSRTHVGCLAYEFAIDPSDAACLKIFEVWTSRRMIDAHACAPETLAFVTRMVQSGVTDLDIKPVG